MTIAIRDIAAGAFAGEVRFIRLAAASDTPAPAPLFMLGPGNRIIHAELFGQTCIPDIGCYTLDDGQLAPTGIAVKDGTAFFSQSFIHPEHHVATVMARWVQADLPVRHVPGKVAVIYGPAHETYGHWLADFLPRLWVLSAAGYDLSAIRFAMPPDLAPFARTLLQHVGLSESQIVIHRFWQETLHADLLLMPTGLRSHNRISPLFKMATAFWTKRLAAIAPGAETHIFLSRAQLGGQRMIVNRQEIEAEAVARGYKVVHPETLTLGAQAALFAGARVIVGEYGSALHGSVYSGPGTIVCGLRGTSRHPSFVQSGICGALTQHAAYVFGDTGLQDTQQRFAIALGDFRCALDIIESAAAGD